MNTGSRVPGLIDYRTQLAVLSPNVPQTNGKTPALDLQRRLGIDCVMLRFTPMLEGVETFARKVMPLVRREEQQ